MNGPEAKSASRQEFKAERNEADAKSESRRRGLVSMDGPDTKSDSHLVAKISFGC